MCMSKYEKAIQDAKLKAEFPKGIKLFKRKQPKVQPLGFNVWLLLENYHFKGKVKIDGKWVKVDFVAKKGFVFDGCSVPRALKIATNGANNPQKILAALIHDWIYLYGNYSKEVADVLFAQLLHEHFVQGRIVFKMKWGVILFAGFAWEGHRKRQKLVDQKLKRRKKK